MRLFVIKTGHAPPDKTRRLSRTKSRPVVAFDRNPIYYWRGGFRNFLPIRERLRLPYGDKRFAAQEKFRHPNCTQGTLNDVGGRCIYSSFLSCEGVYRFLAFRVSARLDVNLQVCNTCVIRYRSIDKTDGYNHDSQQGMIHGGK